MAAKSFSFLLRVQTDTEALTSSLLLIGTWEGGGVVSYLKIKNPKSENNQPL